MSAIRKSSPTVVDELREQLLERVRTEQLELPLLNTTATRVITLCSDPGCDAKRLADLLQHDPALAGHVLRIANSATYAPQEPIVSLTQAVSRMGLDVMRDIALAVAVKGKIFDAKGFEDELRALWIHSARAGAWAKEIARMRRKSVEGAFLSGLLHDVGKPVVLASAVELFRAASTAPDAVALRAWMVEFHAEVGGQLLRRWSMPDWMVAAVRWHHEPACAPRESRDALDAAATTCLANLWSHASAHDGKHAEADVRRHPVLRALDLYADDLDVLAERRQAVAQLADAFA